MTIGRRTSAVPTHVARSRHVATRRAADRPVAIARGIPPRVCASAVRAGTVIMFVPGTVSVVAPSFFFSKRLEKVGLQARAWSVLDTRARTTRAARGAPVGAFPPRVWRTRAKAARGCRGRHPKEPT